MDEWDSVLLTVSFAHRKRLRVELYLDYGDKEVNKRRFDELLARRDLLEKWFGQPLEWERLDDKRASRIAVYIPAEILKDANNQELIEWAAQKAISFYKSFHSQFATP
jgi:hypothetical protein